MKVLIAGDPARYDKFMPEQVRNSGLDLVFTARSSSNAERLALAGDAQVMLVDAITRVDGELIAAMPNLRLIHSEGVAFDAIDIAAARERGIYVCNNAGCNAGAVAETAIMLMLMLLHRSRPGDRAVRQGEQIRFKERAMADGSNLELGEQTVGLVGLGDIATATAQRLKAFGCRICYYAPHRRPAEVEQQLVVSYLPLEELAAQCDIISLHCASNAQTRGMVDAAFLERMKPTSYLVNTSRGDLVDNLALREALLEGRIAGAGFDTLAPEPTPADHPLVDLPPEVLDRVVYSPHLGGITVASFRRAHQHMWENVLRLQAGQRPDGIVNGL